MEVLPEDSRDDTISYTSPFERKPRGLTKIEKSNLTKVNLKQAIFRSFHFSLKKQMSIKCKHKFANIWLYFNCFIPIHFRKGVATGLVRSEIRDRGLRDYVAIYSAF